MRKIPTLFERIYENHKVVGITDKLSDERLQVVLDGKCTATVKVDGSCCAVIDGKWYKRYDAKAGKKVPEGAIPCQDTPDPITGHWPHWVELNPDKAEDKWYITAFNNYRELYEIESGDKWYPITYEAIGPHFQGNPYKLEKDTLYKHGSSVIEELSNKPLTIDILREYLRNDEIEGIVFWFTDPTGDYPICKIKRSDFGFEWPVKDKEDIARANGILLSKEQKPCDDCISRQAVLDTLDKMDKALDDDRSVESYKKLLTECYKDLPPIIK